MLTGNDLSVFGGEALVDSMRHNTYYIPVPLCCMQLVVDIVQLNEKNLTKEDLIQILQKNVDKILSNNEYKDVFIVDLEIK